MPCRHWALPARRGLAVRLWAALLLPLVAAAPAWADNHALLMTIGSYAEPSAKLQGIERDAERARQMALRLGVPAGNITEQRDGQLTFAGMRAALNGLGARIRPGDKVFIYFSGHGARMARPGAAGCQEGLVTHEGRLLLDVLLRGHLERMAETAAQVVMFTDACHAAGVVAKSLQGGSAGTGQIKAYPGRLLDETDDAKSSFPESSTPCTVQVNRPKALPGGADPAQRMFHLAAASDNEAAFAGPQGSLGTMAWADCLSRQPATTGEGLALCAQQWITVQSPQRQQTVTPSFNVRMVLLGSR